MKDWLFYPLAALIIGGMIYYALSFKVDNAPKNADIYERSGGALADLFPSPGTTIKMPDNAAIDNFATLAAHMTREIAPPSAGVFATLGPAYEANFGGAVVRVSVRARSGRVNPSPVMELGYFTDGAGDSGWQSFTLSPKFADYGFDFSPNLAADKGNDYIGIWPDPLGQGGTIEVQSVRVARVKPKE